MCIRFSWKSFGGFFCSSRNKSKLVVYEALLWLLLDFDFLENNEESVNRLLLLPPVAVGVVVVVSAILSSSVAAAFAVVALGFTVFVVAVAFGSILLFFLDDFSSDQNAHDHALFRL